MSHVLLKPQANSWSSPYLISQKQLTCGIHQQHLTCLLSSWSNRLSASLRSEDHGFSFTSLAPPSSQTFPPTHSQVISSSWWLQMAKNMLMILKESLALSFLLIFRPTSSTTDSIKQNYRIPTPYVPPKSCSLHTSSPEKVHLPSCWHQNPKSSFTLFTLVSLSESVSPKQLYLRNQSEFNHLWPSLPQYL